MRQEWDKLRTDDATETVFAGIVAELRSARVEAGLSQSALASGLPVLARTVSEWETGAVEPLLENLILWSGELGRRLVIVGQDGELCDGPSHPWPGESWVVFERRRLAWPLRNRRLVSRMTQTEMGRLVGVSRDSVQRWELAYVPPRPVALVVWAHKLGLSVALRPDW